MKSSSHVSPRSLKWVIIAVVLLLLLACTKAPGKKEATDLAYQYLTNIAPGIEKNEISILKSYEKDADTIMVVQAGGMLCDMPVIKGKDGWIARGMRCEGQFESAEKAEARRIKRRVAETAKDIEELNKKVPYVDPEASNVRYDKFEFDTATRTVRTRVTRTDITRADIGIKGPKEFEQYYISSLCSDPQALPFFNDGFARKLILRGKDGEIIAEVTVNKDICKGKATGP